MKRKLFPAKKNRLTYAAVFLIVCLAMPVQAGEKKETKFPTLYYDKVSMFEILPVGQDEIVFLGDSITERCEWNELFSNNKIVQRGISGDVTEGVLGRLSEIIRRKPKKIFLMIGINDLRKGYSIDSVIIVNYQTILQTLRTKLPSVKLFCQSVLPVNINFKDAKTTNNKVTELNLKIENIAKEYDAEFVNLFPLYLDGAGNLKDELTSDGLHINGKGYLIWKEKIEQKVN